MRLGLALSGGGLRATFFHLGVIRYLSERGLLRDVKHVTSVSGGSIIAAHLVLNWSLYLDPSTFAEAARDLATFAEMDIRGRILRRLPSHFTLAYFKTMIHRRSRAARNLLLEAYLVNYLYKDTTLQEARTKNPGAPSLDVLATNLTRGTLAYFTDEHFAPEDKPNENIATRITLAKAVAISAAFPGFFPPIELDNEDLGVDNVDFPTTEYFTDGGVYDNLGLRRFRTLLTSPDPPVDHVLVCDASGHFDWVDGRDEALGILGTALRSTEIFMKRLAELESEAFALDGENRFTHIQISDIVSPTAAHSPLLPTSEQKLLKNVRTDLDYFSPIEIDALENHGYSVAEAKCEFLGGSKTNHTPKPTDALTANPTARLNALKDSRFRHLRLFSPRDRISYLHLLIVAFIIIALGTHFASDFFQDRFLSELHSYHRDTFGKFELGSAEKADHLLAAAETAQQRWPRDSAIQAEVALAAYSVLKSKSNNRERAFELLERALTGLKQLPNLSQKERTTFFQLQGHYLIEEGERLRKTNPAAARAKFRAAIKSYEEFRRLSFQKLYALEFNLCNTAKMAGQLDYALERCESADRYARENRLNFWQAKAIMGRIYALRGNIERAAQTFHESWEIAARASAEEENSFKEFLAWDVKNEPRLCSETPFLHDLTDVCAGETNPSPRNGATL